MRIPNLLCFSALTLIAAAVSNADEVTDWNQIMVDATFVPPIVAAPILTRSAAIFQAAVFDAVNGIERRYMPIHVQPAAPPGASQRAAAVQAAYATLVKLFPAQQSTFDAKRVESLAGIATDAAAENSLSIARGLEWGQTVADEIWAWRSGDGFSNTQSPYLGGALPGQWRPTPPAMVPGLVPQLAQVTPFAILSPSQFRPVGPRALGSVQYAADLNETETMGSIGSASRTADETLYALFWQSASPAGFWDPVAVSTGQQYHLTLSEMSRLLALINIAIGDAAIGCWDAKYTYSSWRPVTAIRLADTDGNSATTADPGWTPLIVTPPFPEYPSAHSCVSGAAGRVLSNYFGENTAIQFTSQAMPGVTRTFSSFGDALDEIKNARVFGGIHFRTACDDGQELGIQVATYILTHALLPVNGKQTGQIGR